MPNAQLTLPQGSQLATVLQRIGINDVSIEYSRPSVNGREVWGNLIDPISKKQSTNIIPDVLVLDQLSIGMSDHQVSMLFQ